MTQALRRVCVSVFSVAVAVASFAAPASAESADSVNTTAVGQYETGDGIQLSEELILHPKLEVQGGYQPNVFYEDDSEGVRGAGLMRFGAGAELTTKATRDSDSEMSQRSRVELEGDIMLHWNQFISGSEAVQKQSDLGINALLGLKINPGGSVEFALRDGFVRAVNPPPAETAEDLARDKNNLFAGLTMRPGGGALEIYLNAMWTLDIFERDTAQLANRNMFDLALGTRWQWLPKTQLNGEVSFGVILVDDQSIKADRDTSTPLRVTVGTSTLITPKFGVVLKAGYGNGFYSGANFSSYLALAELRYSLGPTFRIAGGYSHDFADSLIGNFRTDHAFYARILAQFFGNWNLTIKPEVRLRDYEGIPMMANGVTFCSEPGVCNGGTRSDVIFRAEASLETQLNNWLLVGLHYLLISDTTDAQTVAGGSTDSLGFVWQEIMLRATAKF